MMAEAATKIYQLDPNGSNELELARVASNLISTPGNVIAVPTETIYGVAADANCKESIQALYRVKQRDQSKPVAICLADINDISRYATVTIPDQVLHRLLPGPVTTVFKRTSGLHHDLNPGTDLIGIRIPDFSFIRHVVSQFNNGTAIALTSANISNQPSALTIKEFQELWPHLTAIFDAGEIKSASRLGSTVVDLSLSGYFSIIRKGQAYAQTLETLVGAGLKEHH